MTKVYTDGNWDNEAIPFWNAPKDMAVTIVKVDATVIGTATPILTYNFEERAFGGLGGAGTDIYAADQAATDTGDQELAFSNADIASEAHLVLTTNAGAESGTVAVRPRSGDDLGALSVAEVSERIVELCATRSREL